MPSERDVDDSVPGAHGTARSPVSVTVPSVSIAILTRNRWDALDRCLASVSAQAARAGLPIVVLVNGTDDDTVARLGRSYPEVTVHESADNLGCPAGRNRLSELCHTDWVAHVDDDGTVGDNYVEVLTDALTKVAADCAVLAGNVVDPEVNPDERFPEGRAPTFMGGICAIRREPFLRLGGYPSDGLREGEETELSIKLHDAGLTIHRSASLILFHPIRRDRESRREAMRTGMHQALVTGVKLCPWWLLPVWLAWKLLTYFVLALQLRAPGDYLRTVGAFARTVPSARRARQPVGGRAILASSGRFSPSIAPDDVRR